MGRSLRKVSSDEFLSFFWNMDTNTGISSKRERERERETGREEENGAQLLGFKWRIVMMLLD
jgi:hypothetical protein